MFKPYNKKYPPFYVPSNVNKHQNLLHNVYALVQFKEWTINSKYPSGMCQQIIGSLGDLNSDYQYILYNSGLNYKQHHIKEPIQNIDNSSSRQDYRQYHILSIDPPGCQDIDDAINIVTFPDHYLVQVHIADVSNFVLENSQLDILARDRISSIYAPHKQINMLPEQLSTNLCSLLEQQDRFVMTINYYCTDLFKIDNIQITNGLINCNFNLDYEQADNLLNLVKSKKNRNFPSWVSQDLKLLHQFISANNILERPLESPNSHDLIDTLMVLTNSNIASYLYQHNSSLSLLRVHQRSEISKLEKVNKLKEINSDKQVSDFLEIYYSQSAEYVIGGQMPSTEINHYGLKTKFYTHFTSPIRRYWDILVHRQLKKIINDPQSELGNLQNWNQICEHINKKHQVIKLCQRQLDNRKTLDTYLDNQNLEVQAFITKISKRGLQVYIPEINICYDFSPFSFKLDSLLSYESTLEQLVITNQHHQKSIRFKLMDNLKLSLTYFKFYPVDKQLSISITSPNILDLIN